eukprot:3269841-Rhodomonas_salina.1
MDGSHKLGGIESCEQVCIPYALSGCYSLLGDGLYETGYGALQGSGGTEIGYGSTGTIGTEREGMVVGYGLY